MDYRVLVFAYDFPHGKSADLISILKNENVNVVGVVGAPKKELKVKGQSAFKPHPRSKPDDTRKICESLGVEYLAHDHDDEATIKNFVAETGANIAIISGARILKGPVIALFSEGVINYHPGKIPETSGLDSFFWMIKKNSQPGITVHFIDRKVDAGHLIFFHPIKIKAEDTPADVHRSLYEGQLEAHRRVSRGLAEGESFATTPLDRPQKNNPLSDEDREEVLKSFTAWKTEVS